MPWLKMVIFGMMGAWLGMWVARQWKKRGGGDARARRGLLLWGMGREAEAREEVAWAWKRRRKLDPVMRGRLREVRREMGRKVRADSGG